MRKLLRILFRKRNNPNFTDAIEKLDLVKEKLNFNQHPKLIKLKEIYITELHY